MVLGEQGFAITKPSLNERGKPANRVLVWSLRAGSQQSVRVAGASVGPAPGTDERPPPPASVNLPEHVRGFLGNLPAEAQQRLQEPFTTGDLVRESDYYYLGYPERLDIWCFLAGGRTITFASGIGMRSQARPPAYSWDLVCRRATVAG